MRNYHEIINQFRHGLITLSELESLLDRMDIRGGIDRNGFTGYDYIRQEWIVIEF